MKIYKNPFVSRRAYFIPISPARTGRAEAKATNGYCIEECDGKFDIKRGTYYNFSLEREMPIVGEIENSLIKDAVIQLVLSRVREE